MAEEKEKKKYMLDIPVNVPPKDYIITGLQMSELIKIIIFAVAGLLIGILIYQQTKGIYGCLIIPVITGMIGYIIFRRDSHTENLIDKLGFVIEFKKIQKVYLYEYYNIYENSITGGINVRRKRDKKNNSK